MKNYLESTTYIDSNHPDVMTQALKLSNGLKEDIDIARACFEFVRDEIKHSWDHEINPVTCKASDVLKYATGFCYAKSHLLAALLRANKIPAGLCYQRITIANNKPPFCLHGLNTVYLSEFGWYKMDARGNKSGVNAEFCPPIEKLAFPIITEGEIDFEQKWHTPMQCVVHVLTSYEDFQDVANNLPDIKQNL